MEPRIELLTILTDDVPRMVAFYRDVLGMMVKDDSGDYVEFEQPALRFAICARSEMERATGDASFRQPHAGHTVELAFPCASAEEVDHAYARLVAGGARGVKEPTKMPWGQYTAFFADPDGNVHEIFTRL